MDKFYRTSVQTFTVGCAEGWVGGLVLVHSFVITGNVQCSNKTLVIITVKI